MIPEAVQEQRADELLKLVALPSSAIDDILVRRGINPGVLDEAKMAVAETKIPITAEQIISFSFEPPFRTGRFGDGSHAVFYTALEAATCVAEIKYHLNASISRVPYPRHYRLLRCSFSGRALMLVGHEVGHQDLVSATGGGAISLGVDALHTRSARLPQGTCVPVFTRASLDGPSLDGHYRFSMQAGQVQHEVLPVP